jgi:hypothetical protein
MENHLESLLHCLLHFTTKGEDEKTGPTPAKTASLSDFPFLLSIPDRAAGDSRPYR